MMKSSACWSEASLKIAQQQLLQKETGHQLANWRAEQLREFLRRGFPQRKDENWKYTSVASLLAEQFELSNDPAIKPRSFSKYQIPDSYRFTFLNGVFSPQNSCLDDLADRVIFNYAASQTHSTQVNAVSELSVFHWLNGALCDEGLFLSLPDNIELTKPVHLLYIMTGKSDLKTMQNPRHVLRLGENSKATVIEEYVAVEAGGYLNNVVSLIAVADNAQLNYYKLQQENDGSYHIANTLVELAEIVK